MLANNKMIKKIEDLRILQLGVNYTFETQTVGENVYAAATQPTQLLT